MAKVPSKPKPVKNMPMPMKGKGGKRGCIEPLTDAELALVAGGGGGSDGTGAHAPSYIKEKFD